MSSSHSEPSQWIAYEKAHPIVVPDKLCDPLDMTMNAAVQLEREHELPWDKRGAVRCWGPTTLMARVHPSSIERTLCILDALAKACESRGFLLRYEQQRDPYGGVSIIVDGVPVSISLSERMFRRPYQPTKKEIRQQERSKYISLPVYSYRPSGELSVSIGYRGGTWKDRRGHRLETQLNDIMLGLRRYAADQNAQAQARIDAKRHMEALHRQRDELRARIEKEQQAVDALCDEANDWQQAQIIRDYVQAVEAEPATRNRLKKRQVWAKWAREQADRLDPLCVSPPSILDTPLDLYRKLERHEFLNDDGTVEWI